MAFAWQQFLYEKKIFITAYAQICLWCLLLVLPVSSITAAREIFTFATLGGALLLLLSRLRKPQIDPIWFLWLAFLLVALMSVFMAVDVGYSLDIIRRDLLKGTLMFFIGMYALSSLRDYQRVWRVMLLSLAIMSICGLVLFFWLLNFSGSWRFLNYRRAASLTMGYGHFATYLAIMTPYLLVAPLALGFKSKRSWLMWSLLLALTFLAAYFTATRILWASLLLISIMYFWFMSKRRLLVAGVGVVLCLALVAAVVIVPKHSHGEKWYRFLQDPEQVRGTAGDLALLWNFSFDKLSENPFKGVGFGKNSFIKAYPHFIKGKNQALLHTHNVFVDYAIQMGVQGLLVFLLFLIVLAKGLWPHAPPAKGDVFACFRMATVIMLCSYMLRNQVDEYFVDDAFLLFWLLMGMAWATRYFAPGTQSAVLLEAKS